MVKIVVDNEEYEVEEGQNLLHACLSHGLELPYFCWHPSLGSIGACRQCAVIAYQDENDERGRLTMACMTPVTDGARISIAAPHASDFRESNIEWLMENHPHDCPVCEEGGECHLQDMTVMTGHTARRYRGSKRTFENQNLGPFINHEMNRCITCYRCVRYYKDYAGGDDLQAFGSRDRMYFGRAEDGVLENEFSGNLVEVCPTGVFTDKPFSANYTRKWDLQSAPSVCPGCAVGCNTFAAERYGMLKRIHNRYHGDVNGYFLCDRGRFGAGFVNIETRIQHVGKRVEEDLFEQQDTDLAVATVAELVIAGSVIGIGSPRASLETNVALQRLVGADRFCNGLSTNDALGMDEILATYRASGKIASLAEVERADAVIVLGEDVLNTAPRIALALRQTVRNQEFDLAQDAAIPQWQDAGVRGHAQGRSNPLYMASVLPTRIDDIANGCLNDTPDAIADNGFAIAALLSGTAADDSSDISQFARDAAAALAGAQKPLVISGTGTGNIRVLEAASAIAEALEKYANQSSIALVAAEANSFGSGLLGGGLDMERALTQVAEGTVQTLIVAENDLFRRASRQLVDQALDKVPNLVVLDSLETPTVEQANIVFPAATFAESTGTFVNFETRAQRFFTTFAPPHEIAPSWRWLSHIAQVVGDREMAWEEVDDVLIAAAGLPGLELVGELVTKGQDRLDRMAKVPRATPRYSGRTAMNAGVNIHEPKTQIDVETPLSYSMEGQGLGKSNDALPFSWSPGWNSNQSIFKFQQEVGGSLKGGDGSVRLIGAGNREAYRVRKVSVLHASPEYDKFHLLPLYSIFGSDELSLHSPPIAERAESQYILLNPADADMHGFGADAGVACDEMGASFAVRVDPHMQRGFAGVVMGLARRCGELPQNAVQLEADPDYRPPPDPAANIIAKG